jgi:glycosyltransferase involved in cell wall biosynthesis
VTAGLISKLFGEPNPTERAMMPRLLFILPGLVPPASDPIRDRFHFLSDICEGEVLLPVWWRSENEVSSEIKQSFPLYRVGRFSYHLFLFLGFPRVFRKTTAFLWYITLGIRLHREGKFDAIVAYGTNRTAVAGLVLKWLTGAKLIVEIPGAPENAFRYDAPSQSKMATVKRFFANRLLYFVGRACDCLKLLYPSQLQKYPELQEKNAAIFHDFVPTRCVQLATKEEEFILCVGYPWYTKGFDILICAFKRISKQFPYCKLKLLGYIADRQFLEELARGCPQIEFLAPCPNELALNVISTCMIYILASRTEGMGRVLLEAMAAGRPIIASNVGGVPHYITDNENGLLFSPGNVKELAEQMIRLLNDKELRARLGERGRNRVLSEFDEVAYVREFNKMLQSIQIESPNSGSGAQNRQKSIALNER